MQENAVLKKPFASTIPASQQKQIANPSATPNISPIRSAVVLMAAKFHSPFAIEHPRDTTHLADTNRRGFFRAVEKHQGSNDD